MARYVATVEMENPHWWDVMTAGMDDTRKGALVSSAADCAREYHDAVKAGLLPYEPALAERSIAKGTASSSSAANGGHGSSVIAAMLSGVLNGVLNDDDEEPRAEPEWRAPAPVDEHGELADFPSVLDSQTVMHAWRTVSTTGDEPVPRCGHCAWTRGAREMWVTHGNVNGRKLAGGPKVLDLMDMSWSTRRARSALDHDRGVDPANPNPNPRENPNPNPRELARITGASAVLAPNGAAYVFGGAERLPDPARGGERDVAARARLATRMADVKAGRKAPMMSVRALDLETRPKSRGGLNPEETRPSSDGGAKQPGQPGQPRRAGVDSEGNVVVVKADSDDSPGSSPTTDDDSEMEWIDATPYADKENGENGKDRFTAIAPAPRMLHSATLIGGDVYVFGGVMLGADNAERRDDDVVLGDLWAYDGAEGTWRLVHRGERSTGMSSSSLGGGKAQLPPAEAPPCPRAGHCACAVDDRFLLIWGGDEGEQRGMAPTDLHVFDTWANRWVQPAVLGEARAPKPRSGAASCVVSLF